jgi:hypothetical protein
MIVLAALGATISSLGMTALALVEGGGPADSGERTLMAAGAVLVVLAVVVGLGMFMDKRARS